MPINNKKVIFVAFAIEDSLMRDLFKGQTLNNRVPYEFIDMSVKEAYDSGWKDKVRTRIKRSDGVIILVSVNSVDSTGQRWEIECAKEENKPILGVWVYNKDRTNISGIKIIPWGQQDISNFINSL
ncbi:TIR domain-containing protein [Psychrobacter arenosus]|uniref:TIR domain-containing protein n=1 Tax=Psychrobacter arenosus TaxID=256326 RepID=UPI0039EFAEBF